MQNCRKLIMLLLVLTFASRSVYSQSYCDQEYDCEAYTQSINTTNWTVYIPIALTVAAVIWFGVADGGDGGDCSGSQDGLGSIRHKAGCSKFTCPTKSSCACSHHSH